MGQNKKWKRQAKKIWGFCFQNGYKYYYCNDCPKCHECLSILGWGGCSKQLRLAEKHTKENRIRNHKQLMKKLKDKSKRD